MKKALLVVAVAALAATSANAAQLWMQLPGGGSSGQVNIGETIDVEIWFSMNAGDTFSNLGYSNEEALGLFQTSVAAIQPNWGEGSVHDTLGVGGQQVSVAANIGGNIAGPGSFHIATQTIRGDILGMFEVTFDYSLPVNVNNGAGASYTLLETGNAYNGYANYYNVGVGSPGYTTSFGSDDREPLFVEVVPEPASFALLALGGVALLRRRS